MEEPLELKAYAKVNLGLDVVRKRKQLLLNQRMQMSSMKLRKMKKQLLQKRITK